MPAKTLIEAVKRGLQIVIKRRNGPEGAAVIIRHEVIDYLAHASMSFTKDKSQEIEDAFVEFFKKVRE